MPKILKAHHTGLSVRSLKDSVDFYVGMLGFEHVFSWNPRAPYIGVLTGYPNVDLHSTILKMPGVDVYLELLEYENVETKEIDHGNANPGIAHIAFFVDDVDAWYEELTRKEIKSVSEPVTPTIGPNKGGRAIYMIDPDNYRVELIQSSSSFGDYQAES
jgi:catechol 2,3-dioxygenase-like lactoylglutathione lyase family enzyme